jgi:hypothetical protein
MKQKNNKKFLNKKALLFCVIFCFIGGFFGLKVNAVGIPGSQGIIVDDVTGTIVNEKGWLSERVSDVKEWVQTKFYEEIIKKAGSNAFYSALKSSLNTIAYDTATWIGSGGDGQKPLFISEGWGEYLKNVGDNAAGTFLETLGKEGAIKFNLCQPSPGVEAKIGLGLIQYQSPDEPECTFTEMKENWSEALQSDNFLADFQNMFEPTSNDLGIALSLQTGFLEDIAYEKEIKKSELETKEGWLDLRGIDGVAKSYPGFSEDQKDQANYLQWNNMAQWTGDAFVDALNIFLNQLALTLFNNLMGNLNTPTTSSPYDFSELSYFDNSHQGAKGIEDVFRVLTEPVFKVRTDYSILASLSSCPNPTEAGTTNCVIDEQFRQAIENKMTVGKAMDSGYLNPNGVFGFLSTGYEPDHNQNYPYRSMIILRKYRILPVGWEIAAQYIKDNIGGVAAGEKTLEDLVSCYDPDDKYDTYNEAWCRGLVDPNWVLKAPLNFCKKEGYGPEIFVEQVAGEGDDSILTIARNNNYCGDEQSCIKETDGGSCELYGYCTKERRTWDFDSYSCEPRNNTCQTFSSSGKGSVSYLENTLEYCGIDGVGCKEYCSLFNYATSEWCPTPASPKIYFNDNADSCSSNKEGCHEFIRTDQGANLFYNSSFEDGTGEIGAGITLPGLEEVGDFYHGSKSWNIGTHSINEELEISASGYDLEGETFTFSFYAKGCEPGDKFGIETADIDISAGSGWSFNSVTHSYISTSGNKVNFLIDASGSTSCLIDAVKLERGSGNGEYNDYRESGLVYQRLAPSYLGCSGATPPSECDDYVRECSYDDLGCDLYSSMTKAFEIPAKVSPNDYCDEECVGFNAFSETETVFSSSNFNYFIPDTAEKCNSNSVGCDEFTNLDEVAKGGEGKEYYTYLKQCEKPSANCSDFYTWEGDDENGYQLKSFNLKKEAGVLFDLSGGDTLCDGPEDYDPLNNPMCLEFYDTTGDIYYRFKHNVVTCSDNCHPYRRTENNIAYEITSAGSCNAAGSGYTGVNDNQFHWDSADNSCYFCKNNGVWNDSQGACLYMAVPGEGLSCNSSHAGCREYVGDTGNNMENIVVYDFESGTVDGWEGVSSTISVSNTSLFVGGNSLYIQTGDYKASSSVSTLIEEDSIYNLSFLAKNDGSAVSMTARFENSLGESADFAVFGPSGSISSVGITDEWEVYTISINLDDYDFTVDDSARLIIDGNGAFYIDNIILTKIIDKYYLINNSWNTPASCNQDINGNDSPLHDLGCDQYKDSDNETHFLHEFSDLCSEDMVGCDLMIDTHNYSSQGSGTWLSGSVTVPADSYVYMIYDKDKKCLAGDKGCQKLGEGYSYEDNSFYSDVYLKNDPDQYGTILCEEDDVGCSEWKSDNGTHYFKDPYDMTCEWKQVSGSTEYRWVKKEVKRCDDGSGIGTAGDGSISSALVSPNIFYTPSEGDVCVADKDCSVVSPSLGACSEDSDCNSGGSTNYKCINEECHYACIEDTHDYECPVTPYSNYKTFGFGGSQIFQPEEDSSGYNWTGICPASESGCSEIIDPNSKFSTNLIYNSDFSLDVDSDGKPDGWNASKQQEINLEPYTLYMASVDGNNNLRVEIDPADGYIDILDENNSFSVTSGNYVEINNSGATLGERKSRLFYFSPAVSGSKEKETATIEVSAWTSGLSKVEVKKAVIDYQKESGLDETSCAGVVEFEDGCVLFNKRDYEGSGLKVSLWDADLTYNDGSSGTTIPETGVSSERDSNILLKVSPDRVCAEWLACASYIKDDDDNTVCYDLGLCNEVDNNGICSNFLLNNKENLAYDVNISAEEISDLSGYAKVGYIMNSFQEDYYPLNAMKQSGQVTKVPNGNFEIYGTNKYPLGWRPVSSSWSEDKFAVISNPVSAQDKGIDYPAEGRAFLEYSPSLGQIESDFIDVEPDTEYILSAKMNSKNFSAGSGFDSVAVGVLVNTYDASGNLVGTGGGSLDLVESADMDTNCPDNPEYNGCPIYISEGLDWQDLKVKFKVGSNTRKIKLIIRGSFWFGGPTSHYLNGSLCHNSGSCDAVPGSTVIGYCYAPGNPNNETTMSADACNGNVYIDDIKIKPVLEARDVIIDDVGNTNNKINNINTKRNITQSCRLYPEDDSLSCSYYEDSGIKKKGLLGYCLEYDRYPGNSDACLLWYPVDKIKGEGIEEGAGYQDRFPLYYTLEGETQKILKYRHAYISQLNGGEGCSSSSCPTGYNQIAYQCVERSGSDISSCLCVPNGEEYVKLDGAINNFTDIGLDCHGAMGAHFPAGVSPVSRHDGWYEIQYGESINSFGSFPVTIDSTTNPYATYLCDGASSCDISGELFRSRAKATKIVQVVTPTGENKFWHGRIYEGSGHEIYQSSGSNKIVYSSDYPPFGAIVPPGGDDQSIVGNPFEWDSDEKTSGNQPLYYEYPDDTISEPHQARAGEIYKCIPSNPNECKYLTSPGIEPYPYAYRDMTSRIGTNPTDYLKNLFTQSYGTWNWSGSNYTKASGDDWKPPNTICGGPRPVYQDSNPLADYCAVPPKIENVIIDNTNIHNSGYINLTFNSKVDSQQLPLIMYSVVWGDGEEMIVSGVEMMDRRNADNPHSLYHLYSYWDLKAKFASGYTDPDIDINCSGSSCTVTPKIKIRDNWGWCNGGTAINDCDNSYNWVSAPTPVTVHEN